MKKLKLCCPGHMLHVLGILFFITSCINPNYDMDKVVADEATVFENISLPVGDVEKLTLEQILFTNGEMPQSVSKNEDGDLYINLFSEKYSSSYDVPASFYLNTFAFDGLYVNMYAGEFAGLSTSSIPAQTITYSSINGGKPFDVNSQLDINTNLPSEIYDIKNIKLEADMKCYLQAYGAPITLKKGFEIIYPNFVYLEKKDNIASYTVVDGHILRFNSDVRLDDSNSDLSKTLELSVLLDHFRIPDGSVKIDDSGNRYLSLDDLIGMNGDFSLYTKDVPVIPEMISLEFTMDYKKSPVKSGEVSLDVSLDIADQFMTISEIPEIFTGNNICLDLYNPQITVEIVNSTLLPCSMTTDIIANNSTGSEMKLSLTKADGLSVAAESSANYVISRRETHVPSGTVNIVKPVIGDIFKAMPDEIAVRNCSIEVPKEFVNIVVGKVYQASVDYCVMSPLSFGEDLSLSFTQDIKNLGLELEADIKSVVFELNLVNSIPLDFSLSAICIDENGNEVSDTKVTLDNDIKAGSHEFPVSTSLNLEIQTAGGKLNIDGLRLTMQANAPDAAYVGIPLNEKQGFEIKDIVLTLPDGIGIEF